MGVEWAKQPNVELTTEFFRLLALCHTVIPDGEQHGAAARKDSAFRQQVQPCMRTCRQRKAGRPLPPSQLLLLLLSRLRACSGPPTPQEIRYEAESPDEAALVVAAKVFGFFMIKRTNTTITLRERMPDGSHDREYDVLNLLEFNSTRKRMSVIVKDRQTGRMVLYCKVRREGQGAAQRKWASVNQCYPH